MTLRAVKPLTGKLTSRTVSQQGPARSVCPLNSGPICRHVTGSYSSASHKMVAPPSEVALTSRCRSAAITQVRFAGLGCSRLIATIFDSRGHPGSGTGSHRASPALKLHVDSEISVRASGGRGRGQSGITVVHGSGPVLGKGIGPDPHPLLPGGVGAGGSESPQPVLAIRSVAAPIRIHDRLRRNTERLVKGQGRFINPPVP